MVEKTKINNTIDLILIDNEEKLKKNILNIYLTTSDLSKENATKNALLSYILEKATNNYTSSLELEKKQMSLYGTVLSTDVFKYGNVGGIKLGISFVDDKYLPQEQMDEAIELLLDVLLNPKSENEMFDEKIFKIEKQNLKDVISSKQDDKAQYSIDKTLETMFERTNYASYHIGDIAELEKIDNSSLYKYYKELLKNAKISIVYSGNKKDFDKIKNIKLESKNCEKINFPMKTMPYEKKEPAQLIEQMQVVQAKLVIGLDICEYDISKIPAIMVYNAILGGTPNSKMFQNVREKAHLCYVARSTYLRPYNKILIITGIECENYEKAKKLILEQLEQIQNSDFTDELLDDSKNSLIQSLKSIEQSQNSYIEYVFRNSLIDNNTIEQQIEEISKVKRKDVIDIANKVRPQLIYLLNRKED